MKNLLQAVMHLEAAVTRIAGANAGTSLGNAITADLIQCRECLLKAEHEAEVINGQGAPDVDMQLAELVDVSVKALNPGLEVGDSKGPAEVIADHANRFEG